MPCTYTAAGGLHSGLNTASLMWLVYNAWILIEIKDTTWVLVWMNFMIIAWILVLIALAMPWFRWHYHDIFERTHR